MQAIVRGSECIVLVTLMTKLRWKLNGVVVQERGRQQKLKPCDDCIIKTPHLICVVVFILFREN